MVGNGRNYHFSCWCFLLFCGSKCCLNPVFTLTMYRIVSTFQVVGQGIEKFILAPLWNMGENKPMLPDFQSWNWVCILVIKKNHVCLFRTKLNCVLSEPLDLYCYITNNGKFSFKMVWVYSNPTLVLFLVLSNIYPLLLVCPTDNL